MAHVKRRVDRCPDIRGTTLYRELRRDYGDRGSYPTAVRAMRSLLGSRQQEAEVRFETDPGHQTQVDWAHLGDQQLGDHMTPLFALVAVLGASRVPTIRFATDRTRATTLSVIIACLADLGGVTAEILTGSDHSERPTSIIGNGPPCSD